MDKSSKKSKKHDLSASTGNSPGNSPSKQLIHKKPNTNISAITHNNYHPNFTPLGLQWSQNSCGFDSVFTVLYSIWNMNPNEWSEKLLALDNELLTFLINGFQKVFSNEEAFETIRDQFRFKIQTYSHGQFRFGRFITVTSLCEAILVTSHLLSWNCVYDCPNGHHRRGIGSYSSMISAGIIRHNSIKNWINNPRECSETICRLCGENTFATYQFNILPDVLVFDFGGIKLVINFSIDVSFNNSQYKYKLAGIIYFGSNHFTSRIITQNGQIWFHDGITTGQQLEYEGTWDHIRDNLNLYRCGGKKAILAFYTRAT
ncbi:hypothetical protein BDZ97DRAFT_1668456 [Flammula alnicola]|nr:hypothetical protein BDZ97DRAFT_1668456 [Flammula alnicola]